ncbi:MAG: glycoside hydrolase family 3 N-terminal domain-containing protein [Flavobacteriaceae bacterium]|nr:glycoside hydrolase family 3 N-terminal domain-containing protein [Flavobacteriaceae bacterium]
MICSKQILLLILATNLLFAQSKQVWVDSTYQSLTLDQKIGQLFMPMVFSQGDQSHYQQISEDLKKYHLGGIIFSKGTIAEQARLTNLFQSQSKVPLLIAMDAEWGMAMRLHDAKPFPYQMTLGAIQNDSLLYKMGYAMANRQRRLGIHLNFAPTVDINTNAKNPVIGLRSLGSDPLLVTQKAGMLLRGMQEGGLMTSIKHFPGHGDTSTDSHHTLPVVPHSLNRLNQVELYPFKTLIKEGVFSVMVGHLEVPALEKAKGRPSSLSSSIVTDLLKKEFGFTGLVVTDALNMKGVSDYSGNKSASLGSFLAGADLLLIPDDLPLAFADIRNALLSGIISEERLAYSVKKILSTKYEVKLHEVKMVNPDALRVDLQTSDFNALRHQLAEASLTVIRNEDKVLPIQKFADSQIAYVTIGEDTGEFFFDRLQHYTSVDRQTLTEILSTKNDYSHVIVGLHQPDHSPFVKHKLSTDVIAKLDLLCQKFNVVLVTFANPYSVSKLPLEKCKSVVLAYQNNPIFQSKAAQLVFGGLGANGKLPVPVGHYPQGSGIDIAPLGRLSYGHPNQVGMDNKTLETVDLMATQAISDSIAPGMQILVAKSGKIIYHKSFGHMRYSEKTPIQWFHRYDLASLTKILASVPLAMQEYERDSLFLLTPISDLLAGYNKSNKADMNFQALFSHHAGIQPWLPFYKNTLSEKTNRPQKKLYRTKQKRKHTVQVSEDLFLRTKYLDEIKDEILDSPLLDSLYYKYSDLPFYMFKEYIEGRYKQRMDQLVEEKFYAPLGASHLGYLPLQDVDVNQVVPSEIDDYYRYTEVQGFVHDMGAAMQNGVGGHAGLFSNANDVAKMMQMFMQGGSYGGRNFFSSSTFSHFNTRQYESENNRRGIGFDKQQFEDPGPTCLCASEQSFGHSGFTGTFAWADPASDLVYVFLSNRTYPTMENTKMVDINLRSEIQRVIYKAIIH